MNAIIETPGRLEPMRLEDASTGDINEVLAELAFKAGRLDNALRPRLQAEAANLVRIMNCYYSNLIEGHTTRPRDIAAAVEGDLSEDPAKRDLQLEARAHVIVQGAIDREFHEGALADPAAANFIRRLHRDFYAQVPDVFREIKGKNFSFMMEPGVFRHEPEHDVEVGRHIPPSSDRVADFMARFHAVYGERSGRLRARLIDIPAAHHRFAYIHPFPDGNGRVGRLMTHAMFLKAGMGAGGLWSISRGLARGLQDREEYMSMLAMADSPRQGDLDGRGNLSLKALQSFTLWFLRVALDQVEFMTSLFDLDNLSTRLRRLVETDVELDPRGAALLQAALARDEIPRGEASAITGMSDRSARSILAQLTQKGLLVSDTPKTPVRLGLPTDYIDQLFPRLFYEV
ncbi:Fic family protein [Caulobacter sp. RL271]|jgi:Fic family protein|uniref:Fic family protein n=1 Tax=Caulobacter segnis TaxID=88688 RepID=A0ABY4ZNP9_9CAUL|nr:Fic family protein [Caulobacter segnis]USQ94427.1 Fic family protein [Caulobacter segnis]